MMFRNARGGGRDILPTSGNGRDGGVVNMYRSPKPSISKSFLATVVWVLASVAMIGGGWTYCSRRLESTAISCDQKGCKISASKTGVTRVLNIERAHMVRSNLVRVKNGEVVDPSKLRKSAQRKLGHSYNVVYVMPDSEDDDDESYDSYEDDDDSYDSYDDDQDSSEEDDDDDPPVVIGGRVSPNAKASREALEASARGSRPASNPKLEADRQIEAERLKARRALNNESRRKRGLPPLMEPDEQGGRLERREAAQRPVDDDEDERFPGDAGTMKEKNIREIRRMQESEGMTAAQHREKGQRAYEEAAKKHQARHAMDAQMKQIGNNLHDRTKPNPNDPGNTPPSNVDDVRPGLERQGAGLGLSGGKDGDAEELSEAEKKIKTLQDEIAQLEREKDTKAGGGRSLSSIAGLEDFDENDRRQQLSEEGGGAGREVFLEKEGEEETLDDLAQPGARGGGRRLLGWKNRVQNVVDPPAPKRTTAQINADSVKAREAHRKGHGHHQKKGRKVADPRPDAEKGKPEPTGDPRKHHHKAFHRKDDAPAESRHHVHHRFHHQVGEKKVEHGWKHQDRQWHEHEKRTVLGTSYNLGRSKARQRKELIDSYIKKASHKVDFVDSKRWRAVGIWMILVGLMSMAFCGVVGNFRPRPKTKKVS